MKISDHQKMVELDREIKHSIKKDGVSKEGSKTSMTPGNNTGGVSNGENVHLSDKAREIYKARKALDAVPEVREEKMEELKRKVESGTYKVKSEDIADKIIKESLLD